MKTLSRQLKVTGVALGIATMILSAASCAAEKKAPTIEEQIKTVLTEYVKIQDALAKDSIEHVGHHGMAIAKSAGAALETAKKDAKKNAGLIETLTAVKKAADKISGSKVDLKAARQQFYPLSDGVIELVKNHLPAEAAKAYEVFYCPMAKGYWIQGDSDGVRNPYYGASMLKCGSSVDYNKECSMCKGKCECAKKSGKCGCKFKGAKSDGDDAGHDHSMHKM